MHASTIKAAIRKEHPDLVIKEVKKYKFGIAIIKVEKTRVIKNRPGVIFMETDWDKNPKTGIVLSEIDWV